METSARVSELTATSKHGGAADDALHAAINRIVLPDPEIEVWLARLDLDAAQIRHCLEHLSPQELQRAERFHFERDRRCFISARGILRVLLSGHLGILPAEIAFAHTHNGKPFVADCAARIHFNLSHSGERALYAISQTCVLGVDIEYLDRDVDYSGLAERFFTRREYAGLQRIPDAGRKHAFLSCWTRKEAVIKATGDGLSLPLTQFEVSVAPDTAPQVVDFTAATQRVSDWTLHVADVGNDYVATVAAYRGNSLARHNRVGGEVTPAVLPHHRRCGSASGGS